MHTPIHQELCNLGFHFRKGNYMRGQRRHIGQPRDRLAVVELVGNIEAGRYIHINAVCYLPRGRADIAKRNGELLSFMLSLVDPTWLRRGEWLNSVLRSIKEGGSSVVCSGLQYDLDYQAVTNSVTLAINHHVAIVDRALRGKRTSGQETPSH
jgi:hypothetical protein